MDTEHKCSISKTIAMSTLQKALITATITAVAGTGIYEAGQASTLRSQNLLLQQQQAPPVEHVQQLQQQLDNATNRLVSLADKLAQAKGNSTALLRLRGEVGRLRIQENGAGVAIPSTVSRLAEHGPSPSAEAVSPKVAPVITGGPVIGEPTEGRFPWPFVLRLDRDNPLSVEGRVLDAVGKPLDKANVAITADVPNSAYTTIGPLALGQTVTDASGGFRLAVPSIPPYQCWQALGDRAPKWVWHQYPEA